MKTNRRTEQENPFPHWPYLCTRRNYPGHTNGSSQISSASTSSFFIVLSHFPILWPFFFLFSLHFCLFSFSLSSHFFFAFSHFPQLSASFILPPPSFSLFPSFSPFSFFLNFSFSYLLVPILPLLPLHLSHLLFLNSFLLHLRYSQIYRSLSTLKLFAVFTNLHHKFTLKIQPNFSHLPVFFIIHTFTVVYHQIPTWNYPIFPFSSSFTPLP